MFCGLVILNYGLQPIDNCVLDVIAVLDFKQCYLFIRGLHVCIVFADGLRWNVLHEVYIYAQVLNLNLNLPRIYIFMPIITFSVLKVTLFTVVKFTVYCEVEDLL